MKINYRLGLSSKGAVKLKKLYFLLFLFQFSLSFTAICSVTLSMEDHMITVSTDQVGKAGHKGCESGRLTPANAYVFTLYRKHLNAQKGNQFCSSNNTGSWIEVARKETNQSSIDFLDMPIGEYKATVYAGQAIGCTIINGDKKSTKSIVYEQQKSSTFFLNNEPEGSIEKTRVTAPFQNESLTVFPNPTNGELNIQIKDSQLQSTANIIFYDLLGRETMVLNQSIDDTKYQEWQVDVSTFAEGAYILRVFDDEGHSYEKKVIVTDHK